MPQSDKQLTVDFGWASPKVLLLADRGFADAQLVRVDPHWFRGSSYLKIGWSWVKRALINGWDGSPSL